MTKWIEQPLRQPNQAWPGLNTRGGRLDNGTGQLEDGSINVIINEADLLDKRLGFIRGIDEYFDAVVCGLFTYTDECGIEKLIVATEDEIAIRTLFTIPEATTSDAYPIDGFAGTGALSSNWENAARYTQSGGKLQVVSGQTQHAERIPPASFARWFKLAANKSYQVETEYSFDTSLATEQRVATIIKGVGDLTTGAFLQAEIVFTQGVEYRVDVFFRSFAGTFTKILEQPVSNGQAGGFFRFSYDHSTLQPTIRVVPTGGTIVSASTNKLTSVQDANLGQVSAIAMSGTGPQYEQVTGAPL